MYTQEISIEIKSAVDRDEIIDSFNMLMKYYRSSGQTQGRIESQYINGDKIVCLPFTLEEDSLDHHRYDNFYVENQIKIVEQLCNSKIKYGIAGKSYGYEAYEMPCTCTTSSFYILITNGWTIESPLQCGDCDKCVPLYKLPKYYDHGYLPILSWETDYQCCDKLQMNCTVGERWALNQMQNLGSQLSKQGIEICRKIEEQINVPVYYFIFNYNKYGGDQQSITCPSCNNKWHLQEQLHNFYDFKCDVCKLVSTVSSCS